MSAGAPATKADLMVLKSDLKSVKSDLEGQIKLLRSDLAGLIKDVARDLRVEMAQSAGERGRTIWLAIATLGAVGILLQFL